MLEIGRGKARSGVLVFAGSAVGEVLERSGSSQSAVHCSSSISKQVQIVCHEAEARRDKVLWGSD